MEDAKLAAYYMTLKKAAPKGGRGGLGVGSRAGAPYRFAGMPAPAAKPAAAKAGKNMLYANFVREGESASSEAATPVLNTRLKLDDSDDESAGPAKRSRTEAGSDVAAAKKAKKAAKKAKKAAKKAAKEAAKAPTPPPAPVVAKKSKKSKKRAREETGAGASAGAGSGAGAGNASAATSVGAAQRLVVNVAEGVEVVGALQAAAQSGTFMVVGAAGSVSKATVTVGGKKYKVQEDSGALVASMTGSPASGVVTSFVISSGALVGGKLKSAKAAAGGLVVVMIAL